MSNSVKGAAPRVAVADSQPFVERACPSCGESFYRIINEYSEDPWIVAECRRCAFVYLPRVLEYADLSENHAWEKSHAVEATERKRKAIYRFDYATRFRLKFGKVLEDRRLAAIIPAGAVLDVGCGGGVRHLPNTIPYGIEVSRALWRSADADARAKGGHVVHAPALEGLRQFPEGMFQGIIMRSFLEHENAPLDVLRAALRVLAPGGVLYVKVPNYGSINRLAMGRHWCGFRLPDHVNYFSDATLSHMARDAGFAYRRLNRLAVVEDNLFAALRKATKPTSVDYAERANGVRCQP